MQSVQQTYVYNQTAGAVTETVNGNWLQAYCEFLGVTDPVNNSWLQALCNHFGITQPLFGSWTIALANYYGITQPLNGTWWYALSQASGTPPVEPFTWVGNGTLWEVETRIWNVGVLYPPVADFTSDFTIIDEGDPVQFTDTSTVDPYGPAITDWSWEFTGGTPTGSTGQNPLVTYGATGEFAVSLTVTNNDGSDTKIVPNYITVNAVSSAISLVDLQLYFPFNGTATDDSGNTNTTTQDSATFGTGKFGQAAVIDANESNATRLTAKAWGVANAYSLSAWINLNALTSTNQIITNDASFAGGRLWQFRSNNGSLEFIRFNAAGGVCANFAGGSISTGVWTHVAATFDTTVGSKLYINGTQVATNSNLEPNNNSSTGSIGIGMGYPGTVAAPLNGSIDEAILYSRALTAGEITILAAGTQPLI